MQGFPVAWQREEKEVPTKSYWRGNGIVYPPGFLQERGDGERMQTFPEQPYGQTFPEEWQVLCQCQILA